MNGLPPLRTVGAGAPRPGAPAPVPGGPATPPPSTLLGAEAAFLKLAAPTREFLLKLAEFGVVTDADARAFVLSAADRLASLNTPERLADALVAAGRLTPFQRSLALAGQFAGLRLGGYRVRDRIGGGSVGVVFEAEHDFLGRRVALKVLPVDPALPPDVLTRFRTEAKVLARIDHPHVVRVYDAGVVPGDAGQPDRAFLVLERVEGGDVEQSVYANGLPGVEAACRIGADAASALQAIHDAGVTHRDLKPSNLLLTAERRVKLIDFGLAREWTSTLTRPNVVLGSLDFLAPEQLMGASTAGPAADVYSLGVTLFWLLTGQLPLPAVSKPSQALAAAATAKPARLRDHQPDAPEPLDQLLAAMLARSPGDRPPAGKVAAALAAVAAPPTAETLVARLDAAERSVRQKAGEADANRAALLAALGQVAAARPGEGAAHVRRVRELTRLLADKLAKQPEWPMLGERPFREALERAAAFHDLGYLLLPDESLERETGNSGLFDPKKARSRHPELGAEFLDALAARHGATLPFLRIARDVVRHHHERWDGTGSPDRLAGADIPPAARVVAVADGYEELRRGGRGRLGQSHAAALAEVKRQGGAAYDPAVVAALVAAAPEAERLYAPGGGEAE